MPGTLHAYRHLKEVDLFVSTVQFDEEDMKFLPCTNQLDLEFFGNAKKLEKVGFFGSTEDHEGLDLIFRSLVAPSLVHLDLSRVDNREQASQMSWMAEVFPVEQLEFFGFPTEVTQADYDLLLARAKDLKHLILPRSYVAGTTDPIAWDFATAIGRIQGLVSLTVRRDSRLDTDSLVGLIPRMEKLTKLSVPLYETSDPGLWRLLQEPIQSSRITELELSGPGLDESGGSGPLFQELSKAEKIQSLVVENRSIDDSLQLPNLTSLTFKVACIYGEFEGKFKLELDCPLDKLNLSVDEEFDGRVTLNCGPELRKTLKNLKIAGYKHAFADLAEGLLWGLEQLEILDLSGFRCRRAQYDYYKQIRDYVKLPRQTRYFPPVYFS